MGGPMREFPLNVLETLSRCEEKVSGGNIRNGEPRGCQFLSQKEGNRYVCFKSNAGKVTVCKETKSLHL